MSSAAAAGRQDVPFRLFGGVGVAGGAELGGPKQRAVLALLLLEPGRVVSLDRIVDAVWGDDPPNRPEVSVRGYVSNLRAARRDGVRLARRDGGYVADVDADDVDIHRFERLVERAAAPRHATAGCSMPPMRWRRRLALWRGRPFGGLADEAVVRVDGGPARGAGRPAGGAGDRRRAWPGGRPAELVARR